MNTIEIPVLLLTGYLGSGKTTLVKHILSNKRGIKFAVIVNDIGEVNIDADLIQKGGVVGKKDDSLVALQNGCICCTLKTDLIEQMFEIMKMQRFDYIVIEASGICEPEPIAQTRSSIPHMGGAYTKYGICRLDCITTVVDALRLQSEFSCGDDLTRKGIDDEDIEFMQHEFISYRQAMDYYNLGYKPIVRLSHKAGAVYKIGKKVLIKRSTFEKYLRENIRREKEEWEKLYQWRIKKEE